MFYFENVQLDELVVNAELVIFDMNGLIVDDEGVQFQAVNKVLSAYDIILDEKYWISTCVGHRDVEIFETIMKDFGVADSQYNITEMRRQKNEFYKVLVAQELSGIVRPGVLDILRHIQHAGKRIALVSSASSQEVDIILGGLGIKEMFEVIVCGDDVRKSKPDPEAYLSVSQKMQINPADCLVFEDTTLGVQSASSAGMKCIAVPNTYTQNQDFSKANFVVDNLMQKSKILG